MAAPSSGIPDAIKHLRKQIKGAFEPEEYLRGLTTGSLAVDLITGIGGFPVGRLSEVFGWESSGKTTLCLQACAEAQRAGRYCAYIDVERGVDLSYADKIGFNHTDETKGLYLRPDTFEEVLVIIEKLVETGEVPLVIVDSVPAMVPEAEFQGKIEETGGMAARGRMLSSALPRLTKIISGNTALVFVNQMRQKIDTGFVPAFMKTKENSEQSSGGSALKFYSSLRIEMRLGKKGILKESTESFFTGKPEDVGLANLHYVKAFKNKVGTPYKTAPLYIRYDAGRNLWGIDNVRTTMDIAVVAGIISEKSSGIYIVGETTVRGEESLFNHLLQHPEVYADVQAQVLQLPPVAEVLQHQVQ